MRESRARDPQARLEQSADMIRSMTAFARGERTAEWGSVQWELRSVNNRYLDVVTKLPEDFRGLEIDIRERVRGQLRRGKVDCYLRVAYEAHDLESFDIDLELARRIAAATRDIDQLLQEPARLNSMDILRWPGVMRPSAVDQEAVERTVLELLGVALAELVTTREREGEKIASMIEQRLDDIAGIICATQQRVPQILAASRERLSTRLAELLASFRGQARADSRVEPDADRLEQEMAILAQKADVAEELDRLHAHVGEVRRVLGDKDPVGRRLDFLMQELNREANTLGSKSIDTESTRASVDLKVLIEQMREQVQNVE